MRVLSTIRNQMYVGVGVLLLATSMLAFSAFLGIWKFQKLTKDVRDRSVELPLAVDLNQKVSELRTLLWEQKDIGEYEIGGTGSAKAVEIPANFSEKRIAVENALEQYHQQLLNTKINNLSIAENEKELKFVDDFRSSLDRIKWNHESGERVFGHFKILNSLRDDLEQLEFDAAQLPVFMQERMESFAENARSQYHQAYAVCMAGTFGTIFVLVCLVILFRLRIFAPLEILLQGSREVAGGNYNHRIKLQTDDELSELADALDDMTQSFLKIQQELNEKVRQRTQEVIRSEKMASVGFLAAGIAHEINNPLASIAWSAESLESRVQDILVPQQEVDQQQLDADILQMQKYLSMIQEEAFRCKEITAALLDFSRMGDAQKVTCNIGEVVQAVVEMIKPMSKYRDRNLHYVPNYSIYAPANAQELKQVTLNLITNALGSVEAGGSVDVSLTQQNGKVVLTVSDDGCGMTSEIQQQLFEPFFTRRRDGQGTGLGLSITYQIVQEHGGEIEPYSAGPGKGSTFIVRLPMVKQNEQKYGNKTAA